MKMTWIIDGVPIKIEKGRTGYFATGDSKEFRGVCMANSLEELYEEILKGIKAIRDAKDAA